MQAIRHLDYYREHKISPVTYHGEQKDLFERRASLYRSLRLPPIAFRFSRVLEVAAGSGQNAQYLETLRTGELVLVEPNPIGWTSPYLKTQTLEEFQGSDFDIVICENWLGDAAHEIKLMHKLAGLVAKDGVLVLTCISRAGLEPNMLRRRIARRLLRMGMSFEQKTDMLLAAFGPHLNTIADMTRSHTDWIHDVLLNPAYDGIQLTLPKIIHELGNEFSIMGTSPEFFTDWRWFKSLYGDHRQFNQHVLEEYNREYQRFESYLDEDSTQGIQEAIDLLNRDSFTVEDVANMGLFKSLFGRETIYVSLQRC